MTTWHLGTVGFGYKEWQGIFYPTNLPAAQFLTYYAEYFNAVEIDATFYGLPRAETIEQWATQTPAAFRFCLKTPKAITHDLPLTRHVAEMQTFVERARGLGQKLGPILIQLPPRFELPHISDLITFLRALPDDLTYAVEFRHRSWENEAVYGLLQAHRAAFVAADYIHLPPRLHVVSNFAYLRFIGRHGRFPLKGREELDQTPRLEMWLRQLQNHLPALHAVYGFFNNDYSGHSPATCNRFKRLLGLPTRYPEIPHQDSLF